MNRKRIFKSVIFVFVLSLLSYLIYRVVSKVKEKEAIAERLQTMPDFSLIMLNGSQFSNSDLKTSMSTVFLYFNTECEFCQHEAESIYRSVDRLKEVQLVFVSAEPIDSVKSFSRRYHLNKKPNIVFLHDSKDSFSTQFGVSSIPHLFLYDKNRNLIKSHNGQLNADGILKILNK